MTLLLLLASFAQAAEVYKGKLVKGEPWRLRADFPRRAELCLELSAELKRKKWLVEGLYVEAEGAPKAGEECLKVERMLPATYDPARAVLQRTRKP